ncbi:MAG: hypothetical protein SH819_03035 [Cytophagales bacterium]|nr:hypothetical protein [Cytophagales bacterium]
MEDFNTISRRAAVKSSIFGLLAVSIPSIGYAKHINLAESPAPKEGLFHRYPSIDDEIVASMVGASHSDLEKVKALVTKRNELARATWDWAFGDWETAIGAASHVGRRDIAAFLMSYGARPDIFTYAMLGSLDSVKPMIEATPGIQSIAGPHGISLLSHAKAGLRSASTEGEKAASNKLISYLEGLGNADPQAPNMEMTEAEQQKYIGDYMYGDGPTAGFSIKLNMRKMLALGKLGNFGGGLYQKAKNVFTYNGVASLEISFEVVNDKVLSLTIHEPELTLTAKKVS